jgi:hypothetical protein
MNLNLLWNLSCCLYCMVYRDAYLIGASLSTAPVRTMFWSRILLTNIELVIMQRERVALELWRLISARIRLPTSQHSYTSGPQEENDMLRQVIPPPFLSF